MTTMDFPITAASECRSLVPLTQPACEIQPAGRLARRVENAAFGLCFVALPLVPLCAPQGARMLVPACALIAFAARIRERRPIAISVMAGAAVAAFLTWCVISLFWSAAPLLRGVNAAAQIALDLPAAVLLTALATNAGRETARSAGCALAVGVFSAAAFIFVDIVSSGAAAALVGLPESGYVVNRPLVLISLLCWPAAGLLARLDMMRAAVAVAVAPIPALAVAVSLPASLTYTSGAIVFLCACCAPRTIAALVAVIGLSAIIFAPALALAAAQSWEAAMTLLSSGAVRRLEIWEASARLIAEHPLRGHGLAALPTRALPEIETLLDGRRLLHPHNGALQAWLDLGVAGAAFVCLGFLATLSAAGRRPAALAGMGALLAAMTAPWSLWAGWWIATIGAFAAAMALIRRAG